MLAATAGSINSVATLLKIGIPKRVMTSNRIDKVEVIHAAKRSDRYGAIAFMNEKQLRLELRNNDGNNALLLATIHKHLDTIAYLIDEGSNINIQNNEGLSCLMIAASSGDEDIIRLLTLFGNANFELIEFKHHKTVYDYAKNNDIRNLLVSLKDQRDHSKTKKPFKIPIKANYK